MTSLLAGSPTRAERWAERLYAMHDEFMPLFRTIFLVSIARAKVALGRLGEGKALMEQAFASFDKDGVSAYSTAPLFVADGYLQLALQEPQRALGRMEELIHQLHRLGSSHYLAEAFWLKGRACLSLGRMALAQHSFMEARAVAKVTSERSILWRILIEIAGLAAEKGDSKRSESLYQQAREIIDYIVDHMDNPEMEEEFLTGMAQRMERTSAGR